MWIKVCQLPYVVSSAAAMVGCDWCATSCNQPSTQLTSRQAANYDHQPVVAPYLGAMVLLLA